MKHWKLTQWCVRATGRIRYSPDRAAVHEELRQHLDDRSDGFLAKGFSEEEAIEKTLDAMGDPAELAPLLAQIHKPFWGYAQDVCKCRNGSNAVNSYSGRLAAFGQFTLWKMAVFIQFYLVHIVLLHRVCKESIYAFRWFSRDLRNG